MKNLEKRLAQIEKAVQSDQYSVIPKAERVVAVSGYTQQERDVKLAERLAEMHRKYGAFDESCLTTIFIRKFCLKKGIVEG
jgi:hypothetical protein